MSKAGIDRPVSMLERGFLLVSRSPLIPLLHLLGFLVLNRCPRGVADEVGTGELPNYVSRCAYDP